MEVSSCYINNNIKTNEIYANWVRKEELERWVIRESKEWN
tara:strand:- start:10 stop:129 length:120 start_codon:yes stop_codon:yes gene_type:complete